MTACCLAAISAAVGTVGEVLGEADGVADFVGDELALGRLGDRFDVWLEERFADDEFADAEALADADAWAEALVDALAEAEALAEASSSAACSACSSVSRAEARLASASVTASFRSPVPIVASVSPALTVSPTFTFTEVTVPLAGNDTSAFLTRASVPLPDSVWLIDPVVAVAVT